MRSHGADVVDSLSEKIAGTEDGPAAEDSFDEGKSEKLGEDQDTEDLPENKGTNSTGATMTAEPVLESGDGRKLATKDRRE